MIHFIYGTLPSRGIFFDIVAVRCFASVRFMIGTCFAHVEPLKMCNFFSVDEKGHIRRHAPSNANRSKADYKIPKLETPVCQAALMNALLIRLTSKLTASNLFRWIPLFSVVLYKAWIHSNALHSSEHWHCLLLSLSNRPDFHSL